MLQPEAEVLNRSLRTAEWPSQYSGTVSWSCGRCCRTHEEKALACTCDYVQ